MTPKSSKKKTSKPKHQLISLSESEKTYAMSWAVVQGDWCFVSGMVGYDYTTGEIPEDPAQQAMSTFANIMATMKGAGVELGHTIQMQYTLTSRDHIDAVLPIIHQNKVYGLKFEHKRKLSGGCKPTISYI